MRPNKIYYVEISAVRGDLEMQTLLSQVGGVGNIIQSGRGTATRADTGWFVVYSPADTCADLRDRLDRNGLQHPISDLRDAPSFSSALAMPRQLPFGLN